MGQVRLASVRRSLFTGEAERSAFLARLVTGTRDVLRSNQGLSEHANYHEFCRLLGRLKTNYQLSELVRRPTRAPARALAATGLPPAVPPGGQPDAVCAVLAAARCAIVTMRHRGFQVG